MLLLLECGSQKFEEFLSLLGEKIRLKGWDKYRGGLDIKGKEIIYKLNSCKVTLLVLPNTFNSKTVSLDTVQSVNFSAQYQ